MAAKNKYSGLFEDPEVVKPSARLPNKEVSTRQQPSLRVSKRKQYVNNHASSNRHKATRTRSLWLWLANSGKVAREYVQARRRLLLVFVLALIMLSGLVFWLSNRSGNESDIVVPQEVVEQELPKERPKFELVYPSGREEDAYDVVRISPDGADASYAYLDRFMEEGAVFRVTQQKIPENFNIAKIAEDFQATNVIQVDETIVYHGYSEKGGVQSLLFEKDGLLILIRSPQRFTDDTWAGYVASMQ